MELSVWTICLSCWKMQTILYAADAGEITEAFLKETKYIL